MPDEKQHDKKATGNRSGVARAIIIGGALIAVGRIATNIIRKNATENKLMTVLTPTTTSSTINQTSLESSAFFADAQEVASLFYCGCGECGDMVLSTCVCESPNGGIAERRFIENQLKAGLEKNDVVEMVNMQFGRKI